MNRAFVLLLAGGAIAALAGCSSDRPAGASSAIDPVAAGSSGILPLQPTRRNPLGYTGRPVDSSRTTTEPEDFGSGGSGY